MSKYMSEAYFSSGYEPAIPKAATGIFFSALTMRIRRILDTLEKWQVRAAQRRELLELDDRMLTDIGANRIDAWNEGTKPFWRD
tara:strand:+ start:169 stop:420 length:252 start_codon:yes stop_codon:yes gene_type:complete